MDLASLLTTLKRQIYNGSFSQKCPKNAEDLLDASLEIPERSPSSSYFDYRANKIFLFGYH